MNKMNYDEAFEFTKNYITRWYNYLGRYDVDYDDYSQNCAVSFFADKKNGVCVEECIKRAESVYFEVLTEMIRQENENSCVVGFVDDFYSSCKMTIGKYSVFMPKSLEIVADMIVLGYNKDEICSALRCDRGDLDKRIENIKDIYCLYLCNKRNIEDEKITTI